MTWRCKSHTHLTLMVLALLVGIDFVTLLLIITGMIYCNDAIKYFVKAFQNIYIIEAEWYIYASLNKAIIRWVNSSWSVRFQAIAWISDRILLMRPTRANFNDIWITIKHTFSHTNIDLKCPLQNGSYFWICLKDNKNIISYAQTLHHGTASSDAFVDCGPLFAIHVAALVKACLVSMSGRGHKGNGSTVKHFIIT